MTKYLTLFVLFILIGYGFIKALPLIQGPSISITFPEDNTTLPDGIVTVSGKAVRAAQLTLNGVPTLHEEDGSFSSTLTFPRGGSILTFVATDRFGRRTTDTRTVFVP